VLLVKLRAVIAAELGMPESSMVTGRIILTVYAMEKPQRGSFR
jgi:hypothetical protein